MGVGVVVGISARIVGVEVYMGSTLNSNVPQAVRDNSKRKVRHFIAFICLHIRLALFIL